MSRRTKRRYAHELYPHPDEMEIRALAVEVPYLYARAIGLETSGTSWVDVDVEAAVQRTAELMDARRIALLADAIHQGLAGGDAWKWVESRYWDYEGSAVWKRARHYGVPVDLIKPYQCGPEPDHHYHHGPPDERGWREAIVVREPESECVECTEVVA